VSCVPFLSNTPVCSDNTTLLCEPPNSHTEEQTEIQPLYAEPIVAKPTLAEALQLETQAQAQITPQPTMAPLENEYAPPDATLNSDTIFELVNQYRASRGLPPFERDDKVCELAQIRSSEIIDEVGGKSGYLHSGLYNRNLPYWIFENAKYGSNEEGTVAWWLSSSIHHQSIVSDYKFSCVKCTGSYCSQLFTSYSPKQTALAEPTL
jgi:uncharacterized protein YkwD